MNDIYNKILGEKVQKHLISLGLDVNRVNSLNKSQTIDSIAKSYLKILQDLGLTTPEFDKTPLIKNDIRKYIVKKNTTIARNKVPC